MAINLPTPRAQPKGEVWFIAIKPDALGINYYISHLIGQLNKCSCHISIATKLASNGISSTKISEENSMSSPETSSNFHSTTLKENF